MKKCLVMAALAAAFCLSNEAKADSRGWRWSPLGVGIAAPAQLPFMSTSIYGLRIGGLYGRNADVYGIDAGLFSVQETFAGLQVAGFSKTAGAAYGLQVAALAMEESFAGLQVAVFDWNDSDSLGVQIAAVNADQSTFTGWSAGAVNYAPKFEGIQTGVINLSDDVTGVQIGVINATKRMDGVQIGLLNLIVESKLPIMVVANARF